MFWQGSGGNGQTVTAVILELLLCLGTSLGINTSRWLQEFIHAYQNEDC
jgi:hypothetical protein